MGNPQGWGCISRAAQQVSNSEGPGNGQQSWRQQRVLQVGDLWDEPVQVCRDGPGGPEPLLGSSSRWQGAQGLLLPSGHPLLPALSVPGGEGLTWDPRGTRHARVAAASFSPLTLLASLPCGKRNREGRTCWSRSGKHGPCRGGEGAAPTQGPRWGTSVAGGGKVSPEEDFCLAWCGYGHTPPTFRSYVADLPGSTQDARDASRSHGSVRALLTGWPWGTGGSGGSHGTDSTQGGSLGADRHLRQLLCRAERGRCGTGCGGSRPAGSAPLTPSPCSIFRTTSTMCWSPASRPCQR